MSKHLSLIKSNWTKIVLFLSLLLGITMAAGNGFTAYAETRMAGVLKIEYPGSPGAPLFNASNIAPGYEDVKTVTVTNTGTVPHSFSIAVGGTLGSLADVLEIEPRYFGTNTPYWNKTIAQIAKAPDSSIIISSIAPGGVIKIDIAAILPESVGNDYQGKTTLAFDFVVGNESTDQSEPTTITLENPSIGAITGTGGQTLLGSGASLAVVNQNTEITPQTPENNQENVTASTGEAAGATTSAKPICFWWWVLLIVLGVFLIVYGFLTYDKEVILGWLWPIFTAAILYCVHWILHQWWQPSKWCPYFVWFELAELILYFALMYYLSKREEAKS